MESPAGDSSSLPHLVSNSEGTLLSWVETKGDSLATLYYAELIDGNWQAPERIIQGTDWFVNWADYPMVAKNKGNYWSHVLKKSSEGTYSYDVKMNLKQSGRDTWQTNVDLHTDGTPTEHGFVTVLPYKDAFFVTWLDGRHTQENEAGERGAMTLRAAEVAVDGTLSEQRELDISTCDCCQTTAAITDNGPVVLYRDRSEEEIRDISIVRQVNGKWTAPKPVHADGWKIKGCPVNGPKVAALGNNLVAAWFTAAQDTAKVKLAFSKDAGTQFQAPVVIASGNAMGRVDVVWVDEETAVVTWMETEEKRARLKLAKVTTRGVVSDKMTVVELNGSRQSGFPQMEKVEDMLYFAWTEVTNSGTGIRMAKIAISAL
ncbi:hypothetical protein ACFQZJ_09100 [Maribacter chungangensis]|uniref:Exo-alpha-sialidase n=1 Tax=Maribacter chungangensis TaxID=1069117 RepID=A0ABW3B401_9FLAO